MNNASDSTTTMPELFSGRARRLVWLVLFLALVYSCLGHHAYRFWDDANIIAEQILILRDGYFRANAAALWARWHGASGAGLHVPLNLEGGFPYILYGLQRINDRLPFLVNSALLPLFLVLLARLAGRLDENRDRGFLTALCALLLLGAVPAVTVYFPKLVLPFRDAPAYALSAAGLNLLVAALREPGKRRWMIWAGATLGLSGWIRLPAVVLIPVALLGVGVYPGRPARERLGLGARLIVGAAAGFLPFVLQNVFEGRPPLTTAQSVLFLNPTAVGWSEQIHYGWHPLNARHLLVPQLLNLGGQVPWWLHALAGAGAALAVRRPRAGLLRLALLPGAAAAFLVFYSCYHRVIPRYLLIAAIYYVAFAATAGGWLLHWAATRLRAPRLRQAAAGSVVLLIGGAAVWLALQSAGDWRRAHAAWREVGAFRQWTRAQFRDGDTFITYDYPLQLWLGLFGPRSLFAEPGWEQQAAVFGRSNAIGWGRLPLETERSRELDELLARNQRVFFIGLAERHGNEQPSWWKDAILNDYELQPHGAEFGFTVAADRRLRAFRLARPAAAVSRRAPVAPARGRPRWLYLYWRGPASAAQAPAQPVAIAWEGARQAVTTLCRAGPNLIPVADGAADGNPASIALTGEDSIAEPVTARWLADGETAAIPLTDYGLAPSHVRMFAGIDLWWTGYPRWERDWGGYAEKEHASRPHVILNSNALIRLPELGSEAASVLGVKLYCTALARDKSALAALRETVYCVGGQRIQPDVSRHGPAYRQKAAFCSDFVQTFAIEPQGALAGEPILLRPAPGNALALPDRAIAVHRIELTPQPPDAAANPSVEALPSTFRGGLWWPFGLGSGR